MARSPRSASSREPDGQERLDRIVAFLSQRAAFLITLIIVLCAAWIVWHITRAIIAVDKAGPMVGLAEVSGGKFLGLHVEDKTHDQFLENPWLRVALREALEGADPVRRFQMDELWLQDGQHPETGESAVLVLVKPKPLESPDPPLTPIAVRRWKPPRGEVYNTQKLADLQKIRPPEEADLELLRDVISGHRLSQVRGLDLFVRRVLLVIVIAFAVILLAGAYRVLAWRTTRWDVLEDRARGDAALRRFHAARDRREAARQLDQSGG